jgi:hypothetical protein
MAKQHKLTIADAHLQVILRAIAKESWQVANPIIQSISVQLQAAERAEQPPEGYNTPGPEAPNGHDKKAPLI